MSMKKKHDDYDQELMDALENNQLKKSPRAKENMVMAKQAARNYVTKNKRINIRLSGFDLNQLKLFAVREGMPYQTLIASIIHKYVTGTIVSK